MTDYTLDRRLNTLALPDEATPLATVARVLPLLLDVADMSHRVAEDGVDGLTYCGLCGYETNHCDTNKPECWGTDLRTALTRLEGTS